MFGLMEHNGAEWNRTEWNGTEWNGIKIPFHCLGILRPSGTHFSFHYLKNKQNRLNYTFKFQFYPY